MPHSDSPGWTVTVTVGVVARSAAESDGLGRGVEEACQREEQRRQQDQRNADQDDPPAAGEAEGRQRRGALRGLPIIRLRTVRCCTESELSDVNPAKQM